jgi:drug/metabolite transporter (DMT)-like permease
MDYNGSTASLQRAVPFLLPYTGAPMTDAPTMPSSRVHAVLVLTTLFWGGSFLFTKIGLGTVPPIHFVSLRFALAALIMLLACLPRLHRFNWGEARRGAIVGLALGITNITFVFGLKGTSISRAGILNNLFVLFIPLLAKMVWRERIGRTNLAGVALAVAGIAILATGGGAGFNRGDLVSTICAFCIALHILAVSKALRPDDDVYLVSLVQFTVVAVMAGIAALTVPSPSYTMTAGAAATIVYCAIFPTVLCFTLQNAYQRYTTPTRAGLIYTLDPVWSLLAGFLVLGERLNGREWSGCGLIFAAALVPLAIRFIHERRLISRYTAPSPAGGR